MQFRKIFIYTIITSIVLLSVSHISHAQVTPEERAQLEAELRQLEKDIAQKQKELDNQKGNSKTLTNEISTLKSQIDKSKLNIKAKTLQITKLTNQITNKNAEINTLENKIGNQRSSLSQLIRKTNELDDSNMIHLILSGRDLSDFYGDVDSLAAIKKALRSTVLEVKDTKENTEAQKLDLQEKQDAELDAKAELEKNKKKVESDQAYQAKLLSISKNKEKEFEKVLAENQAKASSIKARLFNFAGGATSAIPFGTAVIYAQNAETATGTPAALTLAILTQESALGANVGKCYLTDTSTGAGVSTAGKVWPNVMKPTRDVPPFLKITGRLNMDPMKTVVSCPIAGVAGWGGAMGPAQFIASTWALIENRVAASLGKTESNPWAAPDAIMASATYLSDLGANTSYASQIKAACKYYGTGGTACSYGKSVMGRVAKIQDDIDYIKKYGVSNR